MKHLHKTLATNAQAHPEDVMASKLFLRHLGHYAAPDFGVTQFPDRALFAAVRSFQKAQGLKVDGVMKPAGETETAIQKQAQKLQSMGRNGDTILAHISPAEAQLLNDVTDGGSINPQTGLPEFFIGDFFSGLGSSLSSLGTSLGDSFSSIGTSVSDGFSSFTDGISTFGDAFSSSLGDIGTSISDGFGGGLGDQVGKLAGDAVRQIGGDYVSNKISKKIGGPIGGLLGDTIGGAVGNTLGGTVSNAFSSSPAQTPGLKSVKSGKTADAGLGVTKRTQASQSPKVQRPKISTFQAQPRWSNPDAQPMLGKQSTLGKSKATHLNANKNFLMGPLGPVTSPLTGKPMKINSIKPNAQNRVPPAAVPATPTPSAPRNVLTTNPQPVANPTPASAQAVLQGGSGQDRLNTLIDDKQLGKTIDTLKAESPDLKQSYNQWKSDATARIGAKNAELKPQSQSPLLPQKVDGTIGQGKFFSPNGGDYYKSDGRLGKDRPQPVFKNPIEGGKIRAGNMGGFNARRHGAKGYYQHGGDDILAKPGTNTTSMHDGKVTKIGIASVYKDSTGKLKKIKYVEITGNDGLVVRQLYVKPSVKVGDMVKAGETSIGTVEDLAPRYGKNMPNHTHVEVYDTKTIVDNGRIDIKRFKRIDFSPFLGLGKQ